MKNYARPPSINVEQPADVTFAFTMRLLNFLSHLDIRIWKDTDVVNVPVISAYAYKLEQRFRLITRAP